MTGYISVNWVPALQMYNKTKDLQKTVDLPVNTFIPSENDLKELRRRVEVIVGRVIVRHNK